MRTSTVKQPFFDKLNETGNSVTFSMENVQLGAEMFSCQRNMCVYMKSCIRVG